MSGILFVDDDPAVLHALELGLWKERRTWRMVFVLDASAALAALERETFDVVVSDLRMPGMDGSAFLAVVMEAHPDVARVVLSGNADKDTIERAGGVANELLRKPCATEQLRACLQRQLARRKEAP